MSRPDPMPLADREFADLKVNNYHGVITYNWGLEDSTVRPFAFGGLGATQYSPGDPVPEPFTNQAIEGFTRFSTTWGGGVKVYAHPNVGVTVTGRWTPTYINSSPAGIYCSPFWPSTCFQVASANISHQFQLAGGLAVRF